MNGTYPLSWDGPVRHHGVSEDADDRAVARFLEGDSHAFDELFHRYKDYVYSIAYGILGRGDEARDVTQEVFLQVHRSLGSFRRGARFATWLYRIAVNRALDATRSAARRKWLPFLEAAIDQPAPDSDPADSVEANSDADEVQRILMAVPVRHRDVLVLKYYQDLSVEEIAETLGISVTAAKVRLHRARLQFKEKWAATHADHG